MDERECNAICHGAVDLKNYTTRMIINGDKLITDCVVRYSGESFTLDINKAIELGLLIKED